MFGSNTLGAGGPSSIAEILALASLAPGGGANSPLPANPAAGGQNLYPPQEAGGGPTPPPAGMFGAPPPGIGQMARGLPAAMPDNGGGSQFFDGTRSINDALAANALMLNPKGHKGLFPGKDGPKIAAMISAGLNGFLAAQGNPAGVAGLNHLHSMMEQQRAHKARLEELRQRQFDPQQVGSNLIQRQSDGSYSTLYSAPDDPQPFEVYARAQGFEPGTPEYIQAVQDYRLGAWSDPAIEAKERMEGVRYGYRDDLQDQRLDVTRRGQDIRSTDTRRGQDTRSRDARRGQDMTDTRVRGSASYVGKPRADGKGSKPDNSDLMGPVYVRGKVRVRFSKSQNKYVRVP